MKKSKASQIRDLLAQNKTAKEIAALLGVTTIRVHQVKWEQKNKKTAAPVKTPAKRGRPRKVPAKPATIEHIAALEVQIFELRRLINNLQQKRPLSERIRAVFQ